MKLLLTASMLAFAAPVLAQTTPMATPNPAPTPAQTPMTAPATIPDTALSTSPTPSTGPRAQEANQPSNSAADANNSTLATDPTRVNAAPAMASYPICKAGQFDHCMEPGNGARQTAKKRMRKPR